MIVNGLRTIGALCVLGAALWIYLAVPGEPTPTYDATLRRMVQQPATWNHDRIVLAATCAAAAVLWFAIAEALVLLEMIADQARSQASDSREFGRQALALLSDMRGHLAATVLANTKVQSSPLPRSNDSALRDPETLPGAVPEPIAAIAVRLLKNSSGRIDGVVVGRMVEALKERDRAHAPDRPLQSEQVYAQTARAALTQALRDM